ncbi:MAG TPA: biotin transporter BioY [Ktedonobacteraceae bacterium]|nr:biotin transporter BioY [Ktedonobacteraceae bacterium]
MAIAPGSTLVDYLVPARPSRSMNIVRDGLLVIGFAALIAVTSRLEIRLPFTPVPITLQTLFVLLTGAALGSKRGALAMLAYLAAGAAGLPVFSGGAGGFPYLLGVTAGYLWAFPLAAFAVGWLCERGLDRSFWTSALAMVPGTLIIYAIGVSWLALLTHISLYQAFIAGMLPFIPGDLFKLVVAALLLPTAWMIVRSAHK